MSAPSLAAFQHDHHAVSHDRHERRTRWVAGLTFVMMVGELTVGTLTNSLALTADGWHMGTHAAALGIAAVAYWFARTRSREAHFTFGTGKVYALAGYTSAVILTGIALWMFVESALRLRRPLPIDFREALPIAALGLAVNLVSALLLQHDEAHVDVHGDGGHGHGDEDNDHDHDHDHGHGHGHGGVDHNLRAAYVHVLADAFTSVMAILALLGARYLGWLFLDPMMGVVGGLVILRWSWGLAMQAARQILDVVPSAVDVDAIRAKLEALDDVRVADLHLWELGPGRKGCIVSLVTSAPREPNEYAAVIRSAAHVAHVTVEVHRWPANADAGRAAAE